MATYPLTALVLKKTKLSETDLILTLLGSNGALYKAVAKGARKPGSKFGGRAEPATVFEALIARGKSLDIITDANTVETHHNLREDYEVMLAVGVVLDFAATVAQEQLEDERFFRMTLAALDTFEVIARQREGEDDRQQRINLVLCAYLLKGAAMHGYRFDAEEMPDHSGAVTPVGHHEVTTLLYLLGATFPEVSEVPLDAFRPTEALVDQVRMFLQINIPARLRAFDSYSAR